MLLPETMPVLEELRPLDRLLGERCLDELTPRQVMLIMEYNSHRREKNRLDMMEALRRSLHA